MAMEEKRIKYPIGVQTFRDIVEEGDLYIDKIGIIHELVETYSLHHTQLFRRRQGVVRGAGGR